MALTIDNPELEAQLLARARAEGISADAYVAHLIREQEVRKTRLAEFQQVIDERLAALDQGEGVDGEQVMARLIQELDEPDAAGKAG